MVRGAFPKLPTCNKVDKVPGVVVEDGLEVLDELLDDGLHHHPVVVPGLHACHHLPQVVAGLL